LHPRENPTVSGRYRLAEQAFVFQRALRVISPGGCAGRTTMRWHARRRKTRVSLAKKAEGGLPRVCRASGEYGALS